MEALDFSKVTALSIGGNNVTKLVIGGKVVWVKPSQFCYDYVDLGITDDYGNHICFATCNLGAKTPTELGWWFAWGETGSASEGYTNGVKDNYDAEHTKYYDAISGTYTKYIGTDYTELQAEDDPVTVLLGKGWRMPTWTEIVKGITVNKDCSFTPVGKDSAYNNVIGFRIIHYDDNNTKIAEIFIPQSTAYPYSQEIGSSYLWTKELSSSESIRAKIFGNDEYGNFYSSAVYRYKGLQIRPVKVVIDYEFVDLGITDSEGNHVLFANKNLGAETPYDAGWYIAFGELGTEEEGYVNGIKKDGYTTSTYKYASSSKYTEGSILEDADDIVTYGLGDNYKTPSFEDLTALSNTTNFNIVWDSDNKGWTFTSKIEGYEGASIFIPAAGVMSGSNNSYKDTEARLSTSKMGPNKNRYILNAYDGGCYMTLGSSIAGMSIRPVKVVSAT